MEVLEEAEKKRHETCWRLTGRASDVRARTADLIVAVALSGGAGGGHMFVSGGALGYKRVKEPLEGEGERLHHHSASESRFSLEEPVMLRLTLWKDCRHGYKTP